MKRLTLAGIGCGGRTKTYLGLAARKPDYFEVIAAADPRPNRVADVKGLSRNPAFRSFDSDASILAEGKMADVMVIGTQDAYHVAPAIASMKKGYDLLLEKPIAPSLKEVVAIEQAARELDRKVLVCHVLRYSPFYTKVKEIVDSGVLGDIMSIEAKEGVGAWHQTHSYVRGHWAVVEKATPMLIAKSCHDMDIISWLMGRRCELVSSHGALTHFTSANAPDGAPRRCTDGCPVGHTCKYNAMHYAGKQRGWLQWVYDEEKDASVEQIREWLTTSPWGRCVYRCDNTAVDHQVVSMSFEGGPTATFTMTAFASGRDIEIFGTRARLIGGDFLHYGPDRCDIIVREHETSNVQKCYVDRAANDAYAGHGGADTGLVNALYHEMSKPQAEDMSSSIHKSVESHLMGYAAEESRRSGRTIVLDEYYRRVVGADRPSA